MTALDVDRLSRELPMKIKPPALGPSKLEIYAAWERLRIYSGARIVVGVFVPGLGLGVFSWGHGKLWRHQKTRAGVAVIDLASADQLAAIDQALQSGTFQIEVRPICGITAGQGGMGTIAEAEYPVVVLHQATGRALGAEQ
jgi:hypothetical protein